MQKYKLQVIKLQIKIKIKIRQQTV